jgi:CDP-glucose 4,6-dehydratase
MDNPYNGLRVMVTGGYGFKGSWLSCVLKKMGAEVYEYGHLPRHAQSYARCWDRYETLIGRTTLHFAELKDRIFSIKPDLIFHLAAKSLVLDGFKRPKSTFENNLMGAVNVMDACRGSSVKGLVLITTDKVYEDKNWMWGYRENDLLGGTDPYSASKVCIEHAVKCYRENFFPMIAVARAGNVIGGGDWSDNRLIPDIIKAAVRGESAQINTPNATRPWQHVLEPLRGYLMLGARLLTGETKCASEFNFGPEGDMTVMEVLDIARHVWDKIHITIKEENRHKGMVNLLKIDSTKARKELGWECLWDQETAIVKTIEWYRDLYEKGVVNTDADIEQHKIIGGIR